MKYNLYDVYLVNFGKGMGGEFSGKHYAIIVSEMIKPDKTLLVVPITSKKKGKKYRGGFTLDCKNYQKNPSIEKIFARVNKIREISTFKIYGNKIYSLNDIDIEKLKNSMKKVLNLY